MKLMTLNRWHTAILFAFLCLASARAQTPTAPKVDAVPGHTSPHLSRFDDSRNFGKDPFFPRSRRREPQLVVNTNTNWSGELPPGVVLKGLSGTVGKRLAVINNYTFGEGEEAEVRAGHLLYRVKLIEIKDRSVMISVNGSPPRELTLRQGL